MNCVECGRKPDEPNGNDTAQTEAAKPVPEFLIPNSVEDSRDAHDAIINWNGAAIVWSENNTEIHRVDTGTNRESYFSPQTPSGEGFDKVGGFSDNGAYYFCLNKGEGFFVKGGDYIADVCNFSTPLVFSGDGNRFAASQNGNPGVMIFDFAKHKPLLTLGEDEGTFSMLAYSPDDKRLAALSTDSVIVWDARTGSELFRIKSALSLDCIAYSPDGKLIAATSPYGCVRVWDAENGGDVFKYSWEEPRREFGEKIDGVKGFVRFSPDGRVFVYGFNNKKTVQIHDGETGEVLASLPSPKGVKWASYTPDGHRLITYDGSQIKFWAHE